MTLFQMTVTKISFGKFSLQITMIELKIITSLSNISHFTYLWDSYMNFIEIVK